MWGRYCIIPPQYGGDFVAVTDCGSFLNSAECFGIIVTVQLQPEVESSGLFTQLYRKKLHTVYPMLYKPTLKNSKN